MAYIYYTRKFLNRRRHLGGAYIIASIESDGDREPWVEFELSDCSKHVHLDFSLSKRERRNSVAKANLLVDEMVKFRDALVAQAEALDQEGEQE